MGNWLVGLIIRIASGEPLRKAKPWELRFYSMTFAFTPVLMLLFFLFPPIASYLNKASTVGLYLFWFACVGVGVALLTVWVKLIPPAVSWTVAAMAWIVVIVLAFDGKLP
jgi:hypothetical protein